MFKYRRMVPKFLHSDVPYFSQWESPELNKAILDKEIDATTDPNWKKSGAKTKEEYAAWSWSGCGMACTKMMLAHVTGKEIPLVELGKKCAEYGGYIMPLETSQGLIYAPYVRFLDKEFGMTARTVSPLLQREIMHELSQGNYVIASVSFAIRDPASTPKRKGGHLVLMLGYDTEKQEFYFHNPSGDTPETQEYATVSFADFEKFFSGRGVVVYGK